MAPSVLISTRPSPADRTTTTELMGAGMVFGSSERSASSPPDAARSAPGLACPGWPEATLGTRRQENRRATRIGRRIDPTIEPETLAGHARAAPVESRSHAPRAIRARHEGGGGQRQRGRGPQGVTIAVDETGRRRRDLDPRQRRLETTAMKIPQGLGGGIGAGIGKAVLARRHRTMTVSGVAVEAGERVAPTRASGADAKHREGYKGRREKPDAEHAGDGRQRDPHTKPRYRKEDRDDHAGCNDQRPQPFEGENGSGLRKPPLQHLTSWFRLRHGTLRFRLSHYTATLGGSDEKGEHAERDGRRHCGAAPLARVSTTQALSRLEGSIPGFCPPNVCNA